jgi:hypothetical protein
MAGSSVLRFLIIGDDRAGSAFDRFSRSVDKSNTAIGRSEAALKRQQQQQDATSGSLAKLTGNVTGFGDVAGVASSKGSIFSRVLAGINVATGIAEPALAGLLVTAGGLAAGRPGVQGGADPAAGPGQDRDRRADQAGHLAEAGAAPVPGRARGG